MLRKRQKKCANLTRVFDSEPSETIKTETNINSQKEKENTTAEESEDERSVMSAASLAFSQQLKLEELQMKT